MRNDDNEVRAEFGVFDFDCPHAEISAVLGLEPDSVQVKGDVESIGPAGHKVARPVKRNAWLVASPAAIDQPPEMHLRQLVDKLRPASARIREIASKYYVEISLVVYSPDANLGIHIEGELLAMIAGLGVSLDVDVYQLGQASD